MTVSMKLKGGIDMADVKMEPTSGDVRAHEARIREELLDAGVTKWGLATSESRYLPRIMHFDEHIGGVAYGYGMNARVMLVATDRRVIFINKKLFYTTEDEIDYNVVSGVSLSESSFNATVTLYTRIKDYSIGMFNKQAAEHFVAYIETRSVEHKNGGTAS